MSKRIEAIITTCVIAAVLIFSNLIVDRWTSFVDLTDDQRFTLSESTVNLVESIDRPILSGYCLKVNFLRAL